MDSAFYITLAVGIAVGGVAGYLGSLIVSRQMALTGDALGHVALPGMGLALLFHLDVSWGAFLFVLLGVFAVWQLGKKSPLGMETLIGVVFVTSLAVGFFIVPEPELLESLIGDITRVSPVAGLISIFLSLMVFIVIRRNYGKLTLLNISEDLARVQGISPERYNLIYLIAIAVIVSLGVKVTGSLLVGALVIVPAATARNLSRNLKQYEYLGLGIGILSSILGILIYPMVHFHPGPLIILVNSFFFISSLLAKKFIPASSS